VNQLKRSILRLSVSAAKTRTLLSVFLLTFVFLGCASTGSAPRTSATQLFSCEMDFSMQGWSAFFRKADGRGTVTCSNGESAEVTLRLRGGGLTAGKTEISKGVGKFSGVRSLDEIYGRYVSAGAQSGAVKASEAVAMTKGPVSLAIAGTGRGFSLGVDISGFTIRRVEG
jgi:hypothetical protein